MDATPRCQQRERRLGHIAMVTTLESECQNGCSLGDSSRTLVRENKPIGKLFPNSRAGCRRWIVILLFAVQVVLHWHMGTYNLFPVDLSGMVVAPSNMTVTEDTKNEITSTIVHGSGERNDVKESKAATMSRKVSSETTSAFKRSNVSASRIIESSNASASRMSTPVSPAKQQERQNDTTVNTKLKAVRGKSRKNRLKVTFFSESNKECSIHGPGLGYLNCGYDGHAYTAYMDCPGVHEPVVIKVSTIGVNSSVDEFTGPKKYSSYSDDYLDGKREMYSRMMANATESDVLRNFVMPFGTIDIPREMLYKGMNLANKGCVRGRYPGTFNATDDHVVFTSQVQGWAPGLHLADALPSPRVTLAVRRQIVKNLVHMYLHLYERRVLHCDISFHHVHHSVSHNRTTMIDFERMQLLDTRVGRDFIDNRNEKNSPHMQQSQLWQLLSMIGNICNHKGPKHTKKTPAFYVQNKVCRQRRPGEIDPAELMPQLIPAFEKCKFDRPMVWKDDSMDNVSQTYKALGNWTGL